MSLLVVLIKRYVGLILIVVLCLLAGCSTLSGFQDSAQLKMSVQERKARQLFAQGRYNESALLYQRLARTPSARQNILRLQAAEAWSKIAQDDKAKKHLDLLVPEKLDAEQRNQLYLIYAQLDMNAGNFDQALNYLEKVTVPALEPGQKAVYYAMTAFSYALKGQLFKSMHERVARDSYLKTDKQRTENNQAIMELLRLVSEKTLLEQQEQQNSVVFSGWLAIELTRREGSANAQHKQSFSGWQKQYPDHPAQSLIADGYFLISGFQLGEIRNIALLLPESGPYSSHAKALKAGFIAAYERQREAGLRPDIRFYDTEAMGISGVYRRAVAEGAQLVIGPLNKKYIQELADSSDLSVPVMALNYVEGLAQSNLYQFALSPLDEVQQAVRQARFFGYKNAIILAPNTVNGERVSHYFQNYWEADGDIIQRQTFAPGARDFSFPVKEMLNINESQNRFQRLSKVIGMVEYKPRRRQDVDVIFLVANTQEARLINPHFYHNRAGSVAVYGLSKVYGGQPDKNRDIDLEGVSFCTIPWLLEHSSEDNLSMQALQDVWMGFPDRYLSLVAFGVDAYSVIVHLNELATKPYAGATGDLLLNEYNRIERDLVCAKFNNGLISLVDIDEGNDEAYSSKPVGSLHSL